MTPVLITTAAGLIAAVAATRVVLLGLRFDEAQAGKLSRALVVHGAAVVVLAASVLIAGWLPWPIAALGGAMALTWGATAILVGRRYDADLSPEQRERLLEAERRDERPRAPKLVPKRFGPTAARPEPQRSVPAVRRRADDER